MHPLPPARPDRGADALDERHNAAQETAHPQEDRVMRKTPRPIGVATWCALAIGLLGAGTGWGQTNSTLPEQSGTLDADAPRAGSPIVDLSGTERPVRAGDPVDQPTEEALARRAAAESPDCAVDLTVAEHLTNLYQRGTTDAEIDVVLRDAAQGQYLDQAELAEQAWADADIKNAILLIDQLEEAGVLTGVSINWRTPIDSMLNSGRFTDVRIGTDISGAEHTALDFDVETDNAYAAVAWGDTWTVERSPDMASNWFETSRFITTGYISGLDAAVVDEYLYIVYVDSGASWDGARFGRIRRCDVASGAQDWDYDTHVVGDAGFDHVIWEVSLCTNADEQDDRIYAFFLDSDGEVHYHYADHTGWIFYNGGVAATNASGGLDAAFAVDQVGYFLYVSYVDYLNDLHILRRSDSNVWEDMNVRDFSGYNKRTSISVYDTNIICAFEEYITDEYGIRYVISYNSGDSWAFGTIAAPDPDESFFAMADVTARGGAGTAVVYQQDDVTHDMLYVRQRGGYSSGAWEDPYTVNGYYTKQDTPTSINWLPPTDPGAIPYAYGILYVTTIDNCWFTREDGHYTSPGDDCDNPISFSVPGDLTYTSSESTCGRFNDYDDTAMGDYDGGEDLIYRMTVTSASTITISVEAVSNWAGVGVFTSSPPGMANCVAYATSYANPDVIEDLYLGAGTYYIMVDTWPSPNCTDFTMTVTSSGTCPEDLDGDGQVGQSDLGVLLSAYGNDDGGDIDGDGDTDQADLGQLLAAYGGPCP
jgi:hypothetical protein